MRFPFAARGVFVVLGVLLGAVPARAQLTQPPDLLANPGAEEPLVDGELPGWTEEKGTQWTAVSGDPYSGAWKFYSGNVANGELTQNIDVTEYLPHITAGLQAFTFEGYVCSYSQDPPDSARVMVEFMDLFGKPLDTWDSDEIQKTSWFKIGDTRYAPPETRWLKVHLFTKRYVGTSNDAWFDELSLHADPTPWDSLGFALPGEAGPPLLVGHGQLIADSAGALELSDAAPLTLSMLFVSFASTPTPFKGGTLAAVPVVLQLPVLTAFNGAWVLPWSAWPSGVPVGFELYFQVAVPDASAPQGVALSNLLRATQP